MKPSDSSFFTGWMQTIPSKLHFQTNKHPDQPYSRRKQKNDGPLSPQGRCFCFIIPYCSGSRLFSSPRS